jgi:hypothetical protein
MKGFERKLYNLLIISVFLMTNNGFGYDIGAVLGAKPSGWFCG